MDWQFWLGVVGIPLVLGLLKALHGIYSALRAIEKEARESRYKIYQRIEMVEDEVKQVHHNFDKHLLIHQERERLGEKV